MAAASGADGLDPVWTRRLLERLAETYPGAECELDHADAWQLLVATVLSAQCTDQRVNRVTPDLFRRWPGPSELADADPAELEEVIRSTGLFRSKARNLRTLARIITAEHGGEVPRTAEQLVKLPGVGRKTANVVLGEGFGIASGIAVDTHVQRLARRIGLTAAVGAGPIADDLERSLDREHWIDISKRLILHGRRVCSARSPDCDGCALADLCGKNGV